MRLICNVFYLNMLLSMVSINVRGLLNVGKFEKVKEQCKKQNLIFLQETNWNEGIMDDFKKRWTGNIFYNNGDGRMGRGVVILVKKFLCNEVEEIYNDKEGKCIAIRIKENNMTLCNIHAPVAEKEKREFFNRLKELMKLWGETILIGDFNTVLNKIDLAEGMIFRNDSGRKELGDLMSKYELVDIWRIRNEGKRDFSRRQIVGNILKQSRIDFILCKRKMGNFIQSIYYKETALSDHKFLILKIDFNEIERGNGIWVLNTEILKKEAYRKTIVDIINTEKQNSMYQEDKRIWWDNTKYEIKKHTIKMSKLIQKARKNKEIEVRKELNDKLNKENVDMERIINLEEELRNIEEKKCKGAMIRSRAKYLIEGEKCTHFFFNLEENKGNGEIIKELKKKMGEK